MFLSWIFGGSRKKKREISSFPDGIDYHSHILPGVDDGFPDAAKSLEMLACYEAAGIREVWLTPHIMEDVPNETARLRQVFADFEEQYRQDFARRSPEGRRMVKIHLAAENMMDALFEQRLRKGDLLPLAGKYLLVETSYFSAPMNLESLLERIRNLGLTPVLAHPERYLYMEHADYRRLKSQGVKFQRNLFSIKGQYGNIVKKRCQWLMKNGMYDFVGSDIHRISVFWKYW